MNGPARSYGDVTEVVNRHDNTIRPMARRVDTDPSVWQDERSVRPMQDPPMPYANAKQNTPPKWRGAGDDGHASPSPYAQEYDPSGGPPDGSDRTPRREWRNSNSGWSRGNSSVGITGAG